ncbi:Rpp14/Pop5 family-domain-containing protein [Lophiotrema nucula]|uniref:Ribonuclease P/MRP protein subunit POP5 n=1 Tax=Lophiotrema nucula TaxID=690887 RepID=A0A6A5ZQF7_9PLEO|nr:Rpp14/Pop5 family-domain-containing protein [Lophiotrema nucula]
MVRVKNRYLTVNYLYTGQSRASNKNDATFPELLQFHQPTPDDFTAGKLVRAIRDGVLELFGDYGLGMVNTGLKVTYHSTATSTSIIRCPQAHYEMVWAALTFMTKLPKPNDAPVVVRVVRVSGTIKKAEEEVIRRARDLILRAKMAEAGRAEAGLVTNMLTAVDTSAHKEREREKQVLVDVDMDSAEENESESD